MRGSSRRPSFARRGVAQRHAAALVVASLVSSLAFSKPPTLTEIFPPGGRRGSVVEFTSKGSFEIWPPRAFAHDADGRLARLTFAPSKTKGRWRVTIPEDTPTGVYWMRIDDASGISNALPFIVGSLEERVEGTAGEGLSQSPRFVASGRLSKRDEVDTYSFELAAGETVVADVVAARVLGSPMDASLQIATADGFVVADNDDDQGMDPRVVFTAERAGLYVARVFAFPSTPNSSISFAGAASYVYRLTVTSGPFIDHTRPLAVSASSRTVIPYGWNLPDSPRPRRPAELLRGDLCASPAPRAVPTLDAAVILEDTISGRSEQPVPRHCQLTGTISRRGQIDRYAVPVSKGDHLRFRVRGASLGSPIAPLLEVESPGASKPLRLHDSRGRDDVSTDLRVAADGTCHVRVADLFGHAGERHFYALDIEPLEPGFTLESSIREITLPSRGSAEIAVRLTRHHGYREPIEISIADAPPGVSSRLVTSVLQKKTTEEHKLLVSAEFGPLVGNLRIVARARSTPSAPPVIDREAFAIAPRPHGASASPVVWVSVLRTEAPGSAPSLTEPKKK